MKCDSFMLTVCQSVGNEADGDIETSLIVSLHALLFVFAAVL